MSIYDCSVNVTKICVYSLSSHNRQNDWDIFARWYNEFSISVERKQDPASAHVGLPRLSPLRCFRHVFVRSALPVDITKSPGASSACVMDRQPIPRKFSGDALLHDTWVGGHVKQKDRSFYAQARSPYPDGFLQAPSLVDLRSPLFIIIPW